MTFVAWSRAGATEPKDLSAALEKVRAEYHLPACAAVVMRHGEISAQGAVGLRRSDAKVPVTTEDLWHTGSCTKSMTAVVVAMLIDEGMLRWDEPVAEVFAGEKVHAAWQKVTVWDLLTHRGGLGSSARITSKQDRGSFARGLLARPPPEPTGQFAYSNAGYGFLGAMIERVSGKSYEEMLQQRLFAPLGLKTAAFGPAATPGKLDQPWGHWRRGERLVPVDPTPANAFPPVLAPAACVHLSLQDFGRYAWWIASNEPALLKPETFRHLQTPPTGTFYAGGLWKTELPGVGGEAVCHTGHIGGMFAVFYAGRGVACVCAFNMQGDGWEWLGDIVAEAALRAEASR